MQFLLRLKVQQVFILILAPGVLMFIPVVGETLAAIICLFFWIGWIYTAGVKMHSLIPENEQPNIKYFRWSCAIVFVVWVFSGLTSEHVVDFGAWNEFYANVIAIPLAIFFVVCYVYMCGLAAKMIKSANETEIGGNLSIIKLFCCMWVLPFGIWLLQPAVRKILANHHQ